MTNSDLSYECHFNSILVLDDYMMPSSQRCRIFFDVETDNGNHQNTAFDRIKIMMENVLDGSVFININNPMLQILAKKTKQKIITLPTEPLDVIMAGVIYNKLCAIVEDKLSIREVRLCSIQADNIWIHYDEDFAEGVNSMNSDLHTAMDKIPWWHRCDASTSDWVEFGKKENKYHEHTAPWQKDLQWSDIEKADKRKKSAWEPQVIDGGKTKH